MERTEGKSTEKGKPRAFAPFATSFETLHKRALRRHPLSGVLPPHTDALLSGRQSAEDLRKLLKGIFTEVQRNNCQWAEDRIRILQETFNDWTLDGVVVTEEGRIISEPWSTYRVYVEGEKLPPTADQLLGLMRRYNTWFFPLTPQKDSLLFWFSGQEDTIRPLIEGELQDEVDVEDYPINPKFASSMPDMLRMCRVERGKIGPAMLASQGVVLGKIGFWLCPASLRDIYQGGYTRRATAEKSSVMDHGVHISPFAREQVIVSGGIPMDEKRGAHVIRTDPGMGREDFIAAAFKIFSETFPYPLILRFNTLRPWLGEDPRERPHDKASLAVSTRTKR